MQRFDFNDLVAGSERRGAACVRAREARTTKDDKPYLVLELGNASGAASARVWSEELAAWEGIDAGSAVALRARVQTGYRGGAPELSIVEVERLGDDHPVRLELNPWCPVPRERLEERFDSLIASITRPEVRRLVEVVLDHVGRESYFTAPAAVKHHHSYCGGLAEHSIETAEIAAAIAGTERYADLVDRDATIASAIVHDVGKTESYAWQGVPIRISSRGRLRSHVTRGAAIVETAVYNRWEIEAGTVSERDLLLVTHVIESHHGTAEWGSPTPPRSLEATIVHHADLVSARLRAAADDLASAPADEEGWIVPTGWKRSPLWAFRQDPERAPDDGETAAIFFPIRGGTHE